MRIIAPPLMAFGIRASFRPYRYTSFFCLGIFTCEEPTTESGNSQGGNLSAATIRSRKSSLRAPQAEGHPLIAMVCLPEAGEYYWMPSVPAAVFAPRHQNGDLIILRAPEFQ